MSDRVPPTVGEVVAGAFLVLFGSVLLLAGGACTALWFTGLASARGREMAGMLPMLAISLVTFGCGLLCFKGAISCFRSKAPPAPPAPPAP